MEDDILIIIIKTHIHWKFVPIQYYCYGGYSF